MSLSLVALGLGFQYSAYGFFLIAAVSSLAFWLVEAVTKNYQMRHYVRMRQIEVNRYLASDPQTRHLSSPRIDWSWDRAGKVLRGDKTAPASDPVLPRTSITSFRFTWAFPQVAFPHVITFLVGSTLFYLGITHHLLRTFQLGNYPK